MPPVKRARRLSKRLLRQKRLKAIAHLATEYHTNPDQSLNILTSDYFANYASLYSLDDNQFNYIHLLAYAAGKTESNPNIHSHSTAMKAPDKELFIQAMVRELSKMNKKEIIKIIPKHKIPRYTKILRSV